MSSNSEALSTTSQKALTAAADVSFTKLNNEHHAESSSQAGSRSSMGRGSSLSGRLGKEKEKEKRFSYQDTFTAAEVGKDGYSPQKRKSGGFLLDSVFTHVHPRPSGISPRNSKSSELNGRPRGVKTRQVEERYSRESSRTNSPLAQHVTPDNMNTRELRERRSPRPPTVDPAQLVQMALSLSESRKRHASKLPVPIAPAGARRAAVDSGYGTVGSLSSRGKGPINKDNNLRLSPPTARDSTFHEGVPQEDTLGSDNVFYTFSPATLSRAETARRYFELASEHRRLLEHLPPLKSDAKAQGNYTLQSTSSPGSAHYNMTRIQSNNHVQLQLGRKYNPLQALRNRRLRNRERRPLTAPPETWQETDRIKRWIDGVETASKNSAYRPGDDQVRLPAFSGELEPEAVQPDATRHHRRTDTASSVITRTANGWTIEPAELLADTYWVEREDNKTIIEDRNGNRIFPQRLRPSVDLPRSSRDSAPERSAAVDKHSQPEDSADEDRTKGRHRHKIGIPHRLRRNHVSRPESMTSNSSDDGREPPQLRFGVLEGGDENVGPLERHMRTMIAKEQNGELSSPELVSPDHWDAKQAIFPTVQSSENRPQVGLLQTANGRLSVGTASHRRSRSAEGRMASISQGLASGDELSVNSPSSLFVPGLEGIELSTAVEQRSSLDQKRKWQHLPVFRSSSKERSKIEQSDYAENIGKPLSPVMSAERPDKLWSNTDLSRPSRLQQQRNADSTPGTLHRLNTADSSIKESNTKRFFRAGRIGELVRGESTRFGDRFRGSRERIGDAGVSSNGSKAPEIDSDNDKISSNYGRSQRDDQVGTDSDVSPRASIERDRPKSKYYTSNLPSFIPNVRNNRNSIAQTPNSEITDPFSKRASLLRENDRASRIVPPTINFPSEQGTSNIDNNERRLTNSSNGYDRVRLGSQNELSMIPTNTTVSSPQRKYGLPITGLAREDARRQWSISNQTLPQQAVKVVARDIARVRALFLASGIKARELCLKADGVPDSPFPLLMDAAKIVGQKVESVPRKQESVVAARLLSIALDAGTSNFEKAIQGFASNTAKHLGTDLEELSHRAAEQLTKIVHETSDEADTFNVELTTRRPQELKRVNDAIEALFRQRNRQFRWLRRTGFKLLEWLVLGIMWWVWFVVVLINTGKRMVFGLSHILRWLVSF